MVYILLVIIYIAFISLGLPDSILGSAWPSMYKGMNTSVSYAGIITMIIAGGTIVSSLFSSRLIRKIGTGMVTTISVAMTAIALFGFSFSHNFWQLCLWGIPYGLGAGSVDAALNNFVALHYKSKHMSWLHCFWGIGATTGPYIMGLCLAHGLTWNFGYRSIGVIQVFLVACLAFSLPLWKVKQSKNYAEEDGGQNMGLREVIHLPGAKAILIAFFCYCSLEATAGLWASSFMVIYKGIDAKTAAKWAAVFYLGITIGRFISGFITSRLGDRNMVRLGQIIAAAGAIIILLPFGNTFVFLGLILVGGGCAPIYPSLLHETPDNFGKEKSQAIMGMQMASAYTGSTFMPLLFGIIAEKTDIRLYPVFLMFFILLMVLMVERLNGIRKNRVRKDG